MESIIRVIIIAIASIIFIFVYQGTKPPGDTACKELRFGESAQVEDVLPEVKSHVEKAPFFGSSHNELREAESKDIEMALTCGSEKIESLSNIPGKLQER